MKKLLSFFLSIFLLSSCTNDYFLYHENTEKYLQDIQKLEQTNQEWTTEKISNQTLSLLSTPDQKTLDAIIKKIENAKTRIWIESYMLTEKRIIEVLIKAKTRGIDVRVILEKNVYGATTINKKTFTTLQKNGITVTWADPKQFVFTHAKWMIIDNEFVIGTANFTHSAFVTNREFLLSGTEKTTSETLEKIFLADEKYEPISISHSDLVIAPLDARNKLETLIKQAKKTIHIYAEVFGDPSIEQLLKKRAADWIKIFIVITDPKKISQNSKIIEEFQQNHISIFAPKKPVMHAKVLIIDTKIAYIGSINFTTNSIERNREIWILTKNSAIISSILDIHTKDSR